MPKSEKKIINADAGGVQGCAAPASRYAIVLAAGEGSRFGAGLPKQFVELDGRPMLWRSLKAFAAESPATRLVLVLHPGYFAEWDILQASLPAEERLDVLLCAGGRSRLESVANGLSRIVEEGAEGDALVAVHDAARPLLSVGMIGRGWECCLENGSAVPVVKVTDSLRRLTPDGSHAVDRSEYVAVQTPQVFPLDTLRRAYAQQWRDSFTDDASVVESLGIMPALYEGDYYNIKITNPLDIEIAKTLLNHIERED